MTLPPFQQLVDAHWRDVARLAGALAGGDDGNDVAQQAWAQALAAYPRLSNARNLRGWLLTITARAAMDSHRARTRRPLPHDELPEAASAETAAHDDDLWQQVRELPERQRTAIALHYVLDLPHAQVSEQMGTTAAASRRLVSDGLRTLRSRLGTHDGLDQEDPRS